MKAIEPHCIKIDPSNYEITNTDSATMILVVQDETVQHSNDVEKVYWGDNTMNFLPPKSQGMSIMSSDFITPLDDGYLHYNESAWNEIKKSPETKKLIAERGKYIAISD